MTKVAAKTFETNNTYRTKINLALLAGCLVLLFIYAMNVYKVVSRTVAVQRVQGDTTLLAAKADKLDSVYLSLSSKISPDNLHTYGMTKGVVTQYISRTASLGVASTGHEL